MFPYELLLELEQLFVKVVHFGGGGEEACRKRGRDLLLELVRFDFELPLLLPGFPRKASHDGLEIILLDLARQILHHIPTSDRCRNVCLFFHLYGPFVFLLAFGFTGLIFDTAEIIFIQKHVVTPVFSLAQINITHFLSFFNGSNDEISILFGSRKIDFVRGHNNMAKRGVDDADSELFQFFDQVRVRPPHHPVQDPMEGGIVQERLRGGHILIKILQQVIRRHRPIQRLPVPVLHHRPEQLHRGRTGRLVAQRGGILSHVRRRHREPAKARPLLRPERVQQGCHRQKVYVELHAHRPVRPRLPDGGADDLLRPDHVAVVNLGGPEVRLVGRGRPQ
mmetsp:Transcript_35523/g.69938  ORF Transcript_35523/g.69938 Transcript_35523/m.69938 type:complete len:336 (-) Transcript_35523:13-1020(-)